MTFETSVGFDGPMYEDGWAKLAAMIGQRFSVGGPTDWQVAQVTGTRQVSVAAGAGFATGIRSSTAGSTLLTVPQPTFGRWDLLVCRRNWNPNTATGETPASFVLIPGDTTGTTSAATVPTRAPTSYPAGYNDNPGTLVDQPLAWVWTRNSDTSMAVFDLRTQPLDSILKTQAGIFITVVTGSVLPSVSVALGGAASATSLPFGELRDKEGWAASESNPSRITPTTPGWYRVTFFASWAGNSNGNRSYLLAKNNIPFLSPTQSADPAQNFGTTSLVPMNGTTDYLVNTVAQSSGVSLSVTARLSIEYVCPLI